MAYFDDNDVYEARSVLAEMYDADSIEIIAAYGNTVICYDWTEAYVAKIGQAYYFADASGCSCNTFSTEVAAGDFLEFSSKKALMDYLRKTYGDTSNAEIARSLNAQLRAYR